MCLLSLFLTMAPILNHPSFKRTLFYVMEKEMATYSSILAWRISWTEEPGGLQSMGSHTLEKDGEGREGVRRWENLQDSQ